MNETLQVTWTLQIHFALQDDPVLQENYTYLLTLVAYLTYYWNSPGLPKVPDYLDYVCLQVM